MVKETKLYDLLGISPSANETEIKKGYRKMALKYHPDKPTGDTDKFKEISEAFEILSSKDKRQVYDQFGLEAARHGGPIPGAGGFGGGAGAGGAGSNPFAGFGGGAPGGGGGTTFSFGGSPFGGGGGSPFSSGDAFKIFEQFASTGGMGDDFGSFGGSPFGGAGGGARSRSSRMPGGFGGGHPGGFRDDSPEPETVTIKLPCTLEELYTGKVKKLNLSRKDQYGNQQKKLIEITVKPGWKAGTKITFKDQGDWTPHGRQTIQFVLEEKPHPVFKRDVDNLVVTVPLTFKESLLGFRKELKTISGKTITIDRATPISPNTVSTYPDQGMPISKQPGKKGDLVVNFKVDYPYNLTPRQREAISQNF